MSYRPPFFYKYRPILDEADLSKNYALDALFNSYAVFSSRKNFNDLFDSKIEFIKPTARQIKLARDNSDKQTYKILNGYIKNGAITPEGNLYIKDIETALNKTIDGYIFLSVSTKSTSNLRWSHYASSHRGFCIEFKSEHVAADKVSYENSIPKIEIADILASQTQTTAPSGDHIGHKIWRALRIKLSEWQYEDEYRCQLSNSGREHQLRSGDKFLKVPYSKNFVESIIFGCRTPHSIKEYIAENMPYPVKLKQAVEGKSSIEITDSHLVIRDKST